jgi:hypothetical protein
LGIGIWDFGLDIKNYIRSPVCIPIKKPLEKDYAISKGKIDY